MLLPIKITKIEPTGKAWIKTSRQSRTVAPLYLAAYESWQ